ncbi:hypothetical protein BDY17DRAFT_244162 [Neohortaea acidophila]|uniref:DNA-directed RNA polymerase subunit n=1 Tax=Neohortaea acidophila TaxID=245834 RepID=A0A6A6Q3N7_9PEZI|nr:uncharacterized protein BDY17DRAFT_244162 [Neohortaea acidophila]KAF2487058.1 hypothetical protein BDY17DRAFT_244162 [Neohortaea acidophila]
MNTSQPVSSSLEGVHFGFLTSADIRALSAKRITSSVTFDSLLNPIPGGLYTSELGQFGDNACTTCGLKTPQCPGHCGHIELPAPCYHPTFLDQTLRLLRATCTFCNRLKLGRAQANKYMCRLRLVRFGLLKEEKELATTSGQSAGSKGGAAGAGADADTDDDSGDEKDEDARHWISIYESFVNRAVADARRDGTLNSEKTEATAIARQRIISELIRDMTKSKKCNKCYAINPTYRKDRFVKIFRKPLSEKERLKNIQGGHVAKDPVLERRKRALAEAKAGQKRKRDDIDEGVADMDGVSEEDDEGDDVNMDSSEDEPEIAGGMVDDAAGDGKVASAKTKQADEYLNPQRVRDQLEVMFENEQELLRLVYGGSQRIESEEKSKSPAPAVSADMFFVNDILVPPNRFRPEAKTGNNEIAEAQENTLYKNILNIIDTMHLIRREMKGEVAPRYRKRTEVDLENAWVQLQDAVNSMVDRDRNPVTGVAGRRNPDGVKQKLEKKEGMFRKYMMGKRVNFAARTVISPDPNIETNEIGVPPVFAVKLTYPEPVTPWNVEDLQEAVRNGASVWPGAVAIENENGSVVNLARKSADERTALANQLLAPSTFTSGLGARGTRPKKVHRHLNNGDIVIMNRQPTLHKPSMMCHRARVLPGEKTLRMHYTNCNTYNADFDGDEMNLHFPQNEVARAEALSIADTDHQYLSGTAGNPLRGLIQDHISMGVWLTNRDTLFDRAEYMQLLYAALRPESGHCANGRIETVPPAIWKPKKLWTGKQVITSVLKNVTPNTHQGLTMSGKSTTDVRMWGAEGKEESTVMFQDGYLLQGILDKKQIGPSAGGFVNGVYEAYGHTVAGRLLSVLGRLLTRMLQTRAFSCGVEDIIFTAEGEESRRKALAGAETVGLEVAAKYVSLGKENPGAHDRELRRRLEDVLRDDTKQKGLDQLTNSATKDLSSAVTQACLPSALVKPFPKNQMQAMTASGAKGSSVNANQISCNLGQQVLEGRRVPVMVSGKTLPCFKPFDPSVRAGGYVVDRFLTGVRPQEYFFHAMAGREGLIDTAVKTSRSGYLQRCLIKGMEGLRVEHDTSVRDTVDGTVVQFLYGEDGLDVAKSQYLTNFKFAAENHLSLFHSFGMRDHFEKIMSEEAAEYNKKAEKKYRKTGDLAAADPALAVYPPARFAGSTSEKVYRAVKDYADENSDNLLRDKKKGIEGVGVTKKNFQAILDVRYLKSVVEPGDAVGVVAGQSVGEPSTQMTLNTFHLAGHSAKNVTLGIPRLREILMTAARAESMATPTMTLTLNEEIGVEDAKKFAKGISKLSLAEVIDKVTVTERQGKGIAYDEAKMYEVRIDLFPRAEYEKEYAISVEDVVATIEHRFLPILQTATRKEIRKRGDEKSLKAQVGQSVGTVEQERSRPEGEREGGNDDSDDEGDDDATKDKAKGNKQQAGYEAMEDDDERDMANKNQQADSDSEPEDEAYGGSQRSTPEPDAASQAIKSSAQDRENRIKGNKKTKDVVQFSFDDVKGDACTFTMEYDSTTTKILMLHLVEQAAHRALVQSVDNLSTCMLDEQATALNKNIPILAASGVNVRAMWDYQHIIHPHHLYTNSVHDILRNYGVEAARNTIVQELHAVFGGHGISVDVRHLTLIADYMTRNGEYQAFSRMGYRGNTSPFMKMSFETTLAFLKDAVVDGDWDCLKNPSSRIVVGALGKMGTGGFDVFMPLAEKEAEQDGDVEMEG